MDPSLEQSSRTSAALQDGVPRCTGQTCSFGPWCATLTFPMLKHSQLGRPQCHVGSRSCLVLGAAWAAHHLCGSPAAVSERRRDPSQTVKQASPRGRATSRSFPIDNPFWRPVRLPSPNPLNVCFIDDVWHSFLMRMLHGNHSDTSPKSKCIRCRQVPGPAKLAASSENESSFVSKGLFSIKPRCLVLISLSSFPIHY